MSQRRQQPTAAQCRFGSKCSRNDCRFQHPRGERPATRSRSGGGAAASSATRSRSGGAAASSSSSAIVAVLPRSAAPHTIRAHFADEGRSEELRIEAQRRTLLFSAVVDASGSMAGAKSRAAIAALRQIVESVMDDDDLYGVSTFSSTVRNLHRPMTRQRASWARDAEHIANNSSSGARTALYDAVVHGVEQLRELTTSGGYFARRGPLLKELLVITDGQDNASQRSLQDAIDAVSHPGTSDFHLVVVGIGQDVDQAAMRRLCSARHSRFYFARDVADFCETMQRVVEQLRLSLRVTTRDTRMEISWSGPRHKAAAALRQMAPHSRAISQRLALTAS